MRHTPGPWVASKAGPIMQGYSQGDAVASVEHNTLVAGCFSDVKGGPQTAEANARLIAAAPDLLAAAENVVNNLHFNDYTGSPESIQVVADLSHAIAKAKGTA